MKEKRQYTDEEKATALAHLQANGGDVSRTSRELGIPRTTLQQWRDGIGVNKAVPLIRQEKTEALDVLFERVAYLYIGRAQETSAVEKTSGKDAIITAATAVDKLRLLRGQSTEITEERSDLSRLSTEELHLYEQLTRRMVALPALPDSHSNGTGASGA